MGDPPYPGFEPLHRYKHEVCSSNLQTSCSGLFLAQKRRKPSRYSKIWRICWVFRRFYPPCSGVAVRIRGWGVCMVCDGPPPNQKL